EPKNRVGVVRPRGVANVNQHLETGCIFPDRQCFGFRSSCFSRSTAATCENGIGLAEQVTQRINVMDAVEHYFQALARVDPGPNTSVLFAVALTCSVWRRGV